MKKLTPKQRVQKRYRHAYCMRHFDLWDMWCVFLRKNDRFAHCCAFTVRQAWRNAAKSMYTASKGVR